MKLTIYTDETFTEVREVRERERLKIPYRVAQHVVNIISDMDDFKNGDEIVRKVLSSEEQITALVRATFGLKEEELEFVDLMELTDVAKEIIAFAVGKMNELGISLGGSDDDPNSTEPATTTA